MFSMFMRERYISLIKRSTILILLCIFILVSGAYAERDDTERVIASSEGDESRDRSRDSSISFEFSLQDCRDVINKCDDKDIGIIDTSWSNEESFTIEAYVDVDCGDSIVTQSYDLKDNTLTLMHYIKHIRDDVNICKYILMYKFTSLPKKDYKIVLKEVDVDGRCGTPPP